MTELFFLDEVTAYAAGHRPCFHCQKDRFIEFKRIWLEANSHRTQARINTIADIDKVLHGERIGHRGEKIVHRLEVSRVPNGTFVEVDGLYYLKWKEHFLEWSSSGYVGVIELPQNQEITVLTPKSIVKCFDSGLIPAVYQSANKMLNNFPAKKTTF